MQHILESLSGKLASTHDLNGLQQVKVEFLGKNSILNQEMKKLNKLDAQERKKLGQQINSLKNNIQTAIDEKYTYLENLELNKRLMLEKTDLTIPARSQAQGSIHPISQCLEELIQVFAKFGFKWQEGPSIESDWYNFTSLNIDEDHPARQMNDTFYISNDHVLRTHTSPVQIRVMEKTSPPLRIVAPGRVYRSDWDLTHTPMFHQIEGLLVDKDINMGHLKYVIIEFIQSFFEQSDIQIRFRPSFFPFTEPSAEVDIKMQGSDKWLEVLGCGMVHINVLKNVNINPEEYQGFAFGLGIERMAMLKYNINDLRQFFEGDLRWIKHYNFTAFDIPTLTGGLSK